jgi:hypothetical protein
MKYRIVFVVDIGPGLRRLIARHYGRSTGTASAGEIRDYFRQHGTDGFHHLARMSPGGSPAPEREPA